MTLVKDENVIVAIPHNEGIKFSCKEEYVRLAGKKHRDWFSDHAYLCLPLVIGNQYGFVVPSKHDFDIVWNGGPGINDSKVIMKNFNGDWKGQQIESHFGLGIITVQNSFSLRTSDKVNLMTINPPNYFIDGLGHLTGVVECDNLRRDFTFNVKLTRPYHKVSIKKGDWIGCFIPTPRYYVDSFDMVDAKDYLTPEQIDEEQECGRVFGKERSGPDKDKPHAAGRRYFNGEDCYGNKFEDHQKRVK